MSVSASPGTSARVSKVSFSRSSDSTGDDKVLVVSIKTVEAQVEDIIRMEKSKKNLDVKRRPRSSRSFSDKTTSKSTMTEDQGNVSTTTVSSQNPKALPRSEGGTASLGRDLSRSEGAVASSGPCLKHAAQNISRKASRIPSERLSLCNDCSTSMLSYIFLVQDFLDSLATEISGTSNSNNCAQCLREEMRTSANSEAAAREERRSSKSRVSTSTQESSKSRVSTSTQGSSKSTDFSSSTKSTDHGLHQHHGQVDAPREVRMYERSAEEQIQERLLQHQHATQESDVQKNQENTGMQPHQQQVDREQDISNNNEPGVPQSNEFSSGNQPNTQVNAVDTTQNHEQFHNPQQISDHKETPPSHPIPQRDSFQRSIDRQQPNFDHNGGSGEQPGFRSVEDVTSPFSDNVDHLVTTLSNVEREVYDSARNNAGWDTLSEPQERLVSSATGLIPSEAFVTMCRNNAEALGCLVVGTSLLLSRTSRTLCVLVADGVSNAFRGSLSSVFHVVQCVRSLDSLGTTKLSLLEQPELGISFDKLNIWRLTQFNKCVFLNPDTIVLQNSDELFCREELSAVADIGWPDCFNSGVFVFVPSQKTFWQLLDFAEKQGSYDGGDQGLLNSYYNNWSSDMSKKLSFIYNLMANVSYTYTPAFRQFGRDVKIVQFHGSFKPWHVKFHSRTGQISPSSPVHPTYVQFVHIWINMFRISALRQLAKDIQSYAISQEVICAVELLRFFPLPTESEADFYLTPPSVRLRIAETKMVQVSSKLNVEAKHRRKSAEFPSYSAQDDDVFAPGDERKAHDVASAALKDVAESKVDENESVVVAEESEAASESAAAKTKSLLPGSEIGDYQGMKAWEQGRMDYQGTDSSDNILKRLEFMMAQPKN